ncbi:MAG: glycosyltransferase family 2 protein [Actinomycetota bacterium]
MAGNNVDLSVVIPAYNPGRYLQHCLESVADQDLADMSVEIIAVDDGSTDGSAELLERWADKLRSMAVIHEPNSGGPGRPRNIGLNRATGRYVFFLDADDYLGIESLRRMVAFADLHESDLVIPKLVGVNGRWIRESVYRETQVDADLLKASQASGPTKLFRRSVIEENGLRFPEGNVPAEDTVFLFNMFAVARRISIVADYDYYFVQLRDDAANRTMQPVDPYMYASSLIAAMQAIQGRLHDRVIEMELCLELFRRVGLNKYGPSYADARSKRQQDWVQAHRGIILRFFPPGSEMALKSPARERMALIREQRVSDLASLATIASIPKLRSTAEQVWSRRQHMVINGEVSLESAFRRLDNVHVELVPRDKRRVLSFESAGCKLGVDPGMSQIAPPKEKFELVLETALFQAVPDGIWDIFLVASTAGRRTRGRLAVAPGLEMSAMHSYGKSIIPYETVHHNLSVKVNNRRAERSPYQAMLCRIRAALRRLKRPGRARAKS